MILRGRYTSEFQDDHTRAVILRGGSNYNPYRGKECRWIDNDDGTPKLWGTSGHDGMPACFNSSVDGMAEMIAANNNVPGSKRPHPNGGSHWYFPPAYQLNSYNKYYLMSGSYERAGTVGFRCIADAVDAPHPPPPPPSPSPPTPSDSHGCMTGNPRQLCVLPLVSTYPQTPANPTGNFPVVLSEPSAPSNRVLDWIHWGHQRLFLPPVPVPGGQSSGSQQNPWTATRKSDGLTPDMFAPQNTTGPLGPTTGVLLDLATPIVYTWTGGACEPPVADPPGCPLHQFGYQAGDKAGVGTNGSISMVIPEHQERWKLRLFLGVTNGTGKLTVAQAGQPTVTQRLDTATQPRDTSGDDMQEWNIAMSMTATIFFTGSVNVTWAMEVAGTVHSQVSLHAATLEEPHGDN